jgi:SAM-dependent methyltransferase
MLGVTMARWSLPTQDPWSTPFAETLLSQLSLSRGLHILDVTSGHGIPAFYLAEQVGPTGRVLGIDLSAGQVARARAIQGAQLPWLSFECHDVRELPAEWPLFDRITGNLSVMFFRPNREETLRGLIRRLKPGGQLVLTFPSLGTFDSLWQRVDCELLRRGHSAERERFQAYRAERPSAKDARRWLVAFAMIGIAVIEQPLEVVSGPGHAFLNHPLLRGGFLDDVYECFEDQRQADAMMTAISADLAGFAPLIALRCVMSAWKANRS